jgi:hypothetical protein
MREATWATTLDLMALEKETPLIARTLVAKVKNPRWISDGMTLIAELRTRAIPVAKDDND